MRLTLRHRLFIVSLFLLMVLAGALLLTRRSPHELARWKAAQAARGESFILVEIAPPFSEARLAWEKSLGDAAQNLDRTPAGIELKRPAGRGQAGAAWQSTDPFNRKSMVNGWPPLLESMRANEPSLAEIRALMRSVPAGSIYDWRDPFAARRLMNFVARRTAAQNLAAGVVAELHEGRLDPALTNLHSLVAFAGIRDSGGLLVDHMIQTAIGGLGIAATWEALAAPGWDEPRLAALQRAWERTDLLTNIGRTAELERAFACAYFSLARTNPPALRQAIAVGGSSAAGSFGDNLRDAVLSSFWRPDDDELLFLKVMQPLVDCLRATGTNVDYVHIRQAWAQSQTLLAAHSGKLDQLRYSFTRMVTPNWEKACLSLWKQETQRRLAIIAVALRRCQLRHGRLPESLAALSSEFLAVVPPDPLSGQPWHYHAASDGAVELFSLGENGRNERGGGDDLAWPQLVPPVNSSP